MKVLFKKRSGIETFDVMIDGKKSDWWFSRDNYNSSSFYLLNKGKRFRGRFEKLSDLQIFLQGELLSKVASDLTGLK